MDTQKHSKGQEDVSAYYDAIAQSYHEQYEPELLLSKGRYPANYFRLQLLLKSFSEKKIKRVLEVGVGEGTPLVTLAKGGMAVWGFDISIGMVEAAKKNFLKNGLDPECIFSADIQEEKTLKPIRHVGPFDAVLALGVMPHVKNDDITLKNIAKFVRPRGSVFIEFRNKLFSLFTFNRSTLEFILDDLLADIDPVLRSNVTKELKSRLRMDLPPMRHKVEGTDAPGYDVIPSKFHNPLTITDLFARNGFRDCRFLWYHYHPAMPLVEERFPDLFRKEAIKLESNSSDWRGYFMCSAFVVEAVKL